MLLRPARDYPRQAIHRTQGAQNIRESIQDVAMAEPIPRHPLVPLPQPLPSCRCSTSMLQPNNMLTTSRLFRPPRWFGTCTHFSPPSATSSTHALISPLLSRARSSTSLRAVGTSSALSSAGGTQITSSRSTSAFAATVKLRTVSAAVCGSSAVSSQHACSSMDGVLRRESAESRCR